MGGTSWGCRCLSAERLASYSLTGCSLRSRACWAFLVPTEYEPTTSRTWGLTHCIGEFSFHRPHVPCLLRVKADVGRLLGFPWVQIRPWKEVLARGRLAKMWRQWQGSMLVPDLWDEAVTSPANLGHIGESPGHQWLCEMTPIPLKGKDIPTHIYHPFPLYRPTFHFSWTWGKGKFELLASSSKK